MKTAAFVLSLKKYYERLDIISLFSKFLLDSLNEKKKSVIPKSIKV